MIKSKIKSLMEFLFKFFDDIFNILYFFLIFLNLSPEEPFPIINTFFHLTDVY